MKRSPWRNDRGATTIEFAFVAILLLMIVFGIIEFGILMFDKHVLTNATREGARVGVIMRAERVSNDDIKKIIEGYAEEHMLGFDPSSKLDFGPWEGEDPWIVPASRNGSEFGDELTVTVKYPFKFLVLSNFGLGEVMLEAKTRMRME